MLEGRVNLKLHCSNAGLSNVIVTQNLFIFFISLQVDKGEEERDIQLSNLLYRKYTHTYNTYGQTSSYVILIALETWCMQNTI